MRDRRRHPRGLRPHAERARGRRRVGAGQEVHGQHERRDLDHHHQVALHGAHLVHRAAAQRGARHLGLQERRAQGLHAGVRLRPGPRRRSRVPARASRTPAARSSARRAIRWRTSTSPRSCSAPRTPIRTASTSGCRAARSRRRSARRSPSAASTRARSRCMGQGELTYEEALKSMGDAGLGLITAFHYDYNHQSAKNKAVRRRLQRRVQAQPRHVLGRRL